MTLKCDNCKKLKCAQAERNCKGFLDAAGKWIGGVVNAAGKAPVFVSLSQTYNVYDKDDDDDYGFDNRAFHKLLSNFLATFHDSSNFFPFEQLFSS